MLPVQKSSGGLATLFGDCAIYSCILRVWLGLQVLLKLAIFHLGLSFNKWPGDPFLMRRRANFYIKKFQTKCSLGFLRIFATPVFELWHKYWKESWIILDLHGGGANLLGVCSRPACTSWKPLHQHLAWRWHYLRVLQTRISAFDTACARNVRSCALLP